MAPVKAAASCALVFAHIEGHSCTKLTVWKDDWWRRRAISKEIHEGFGEEGRCARFLDDADQHVHAKDKGGQKAIIR